MLRFSALNDEAKDENSESENEEIAVTKEAQETIAESEYLRAIKYKSDGNSTDALLLLEELLETKVLNEILAEDANEKLWAIRYNCHKNLALINEENGNNEEAIKHYLCAMNIDETDVYTMHRFGQLALKNDLLDLAETAFEKCLSRNPTHWRAEDGILQVLCRNHNIIGAYGYALKLYRKDSDNERAELVLREITTKFVDSLPYFSLFWGEAPECILSNPWKEECGTAFPIRKKKSEDTLKTIQPTDIEQFRIKDLSWSSLGNYILHLYKHLKKTEQSMFFTLNFEDIIRLDNRDEENMETETLNNNESPASQSVDQESNAENSNGGSTQANNNNTSCNNNTNTNGNTNNNGNNNDLDISDKSSNPSLFATPPPICENANPPSNDEPTVAEANEDCNKLDGAVDAATKSKPRRRCSDIHLLEQWGWHKSRRYSSRKKPQTDRPEVDTSLNGYLKRFFAKYMNETFENTWPFSINDEQQLEADVKTESTADDTENSCKICHDNVTLKGFQEETESTFELLLNKLKSKHFDIMALIYKWLKYMSFNWEHQIPQELQIIYLEIFELYLQHFDFSTWDQLNDNNFEACYRICLLFLEFDFNKTIKSESDLTTQWKNTFNQLLFKSGIAYVILIEQFDIYKLRLANLEYLWCSYSQELEKCVTCLLNMEEIIETKDDDFALHLPNMKPKCKITKDIVIKTRESYQRQISLQRIPKLYEEEKWQEITEIIKDNLRHSQDLSKCENWLKDFGVQVEILLQSLWNLNEYEECIQWAEKFMHYCTSHYLLENKFSYRQKLWSEWIHYIFTYFEALILNEGFNILSSLSDTLLSRLVQNIVRILSYQLDGAFDKNSNTAFDLQTKRLWVVLHQLLLREESHNMPVVKSKTNSESEDEEELLPNSFLVLFTGHEFLGKRQWCANDNGEFLYYILDTVTSNLRAPLYDSCRDILYEYLEQVTYCLYGYPQKKARLRHLEDHEATNIELTWPKAIQLFDLYRPDSLPEFNSYKLESITSDMEQLLLKIIGLMPSEFDPHASSAEIVKYISGNTKQLPDENTSFKLPYKINSIFYLLGDYYFKNRDFSKAIKYLTLDLSCKPGRFDSWAGIALSKASKIETKLNALQPIDLSSLLTECDETMRCFERCINLDRNQTLLWIEYGSFTYTISSHCSRFLKEMPDHDNPDDLRSAEERKENMLNIASNCFSYATTLQSAGNTESESNDDSESHDEKWLCQYMLGKISEKRKEDPKIYINFYLSAANYLYENNATYPIKINHSNPTTLSVEALEVFYRTNSSIIKYLEKHQEINRETGAFFTTVLRNLSNSPFAFNKAKVDGSALKRKMADKIDNQQSSSSPKALKEDNNVLSNSNSPSVFEKPTEQKPEDVPKADSSTATTTIATAAATTNTTATTTTTSITTKEAATVSASPSRRESQESAATGTTTTVTTSTATSSTSNSETSSSDSDSESDESSAESSKKNGEKSASIYSKEKIKNLYKMIIQNLEECITRFPEHYKSIYRLVYHYLNAPTELNNLKKAEELLIGQYKTSLGNQINGLFYDRKNNNLFNGIWRIPSSEIDRPGSFSAHLVKCVDLLEKMLLSSNNHKMLIDIGLQLYRTPDNDKRYITDKSRVELYQQSIVHCGRVMRTLLSKCKEKRDDEEILNLLIDIYKMHKKCIKYINTKEPVFMHILIDVYKLFIQDKVDYIPENLNFFDLAIKLCVQEIAARKTLEKANSMSNGAKTNFSLGDAMLGITSSDNQNLLPPRPIQIPGLSMRMRNRPQVGNAKLQPFMASIQQQQQQLHTTFQIQLSQQQQQFQQQYNQQQLPKPQLPVFNSSKFVESLSSAVNAEMFKLPNVVATSPTSMGTLPSSANENLGVQQILRDFYKQLLETSKPIPTPMSLASVSMAAAMSHTSMSSNPTYSLTSSLPAETTITPAISHSNTGIQNLHSTQQQQAKMFMSNDLSMPTGIDLTSSDLVITPSTSMPSSMPTSIGGTTSLTVVETPQSQTNVKKPMIYVQPLANLQSPPQTQLASVTSTPADTSAYNATNIGGKAKSTVKAKQHQMSMQKPYERPMPVPVTTTAAANLMHPGLGQGRPGVDYPTPLSLLQSLKPEQQAEFLKVYAEFLKNPHLQPFPSFTEKPPRATQKRKTKSAQMPTATIAAQQQLGSSVSVSVVTTAASMQNLSAAQQLPTTSNVFRMPTFDPKAITISPLTSIPSTMSQDIKPSFTLTPMQTGTGIYSQQNVGVSFSSTTQSSPTKTLQQKLAERQKANQMNDAKMPMNSSNETQKHANIETIILD